MNTSSNKESWIKNFFRHRRPAVIKNRLAAELTSRYSGTGPKYDSASSETHFRSQEFMMNLTDT